MTDPEYYNEPPTLDFDGSPDSHLPEKETTIKDIIDEGVFHGEAEDYLPPKTYNALLDINHYAVDALAQKILLSGGTNKIDNTIHDDARTIIEASTFKNSKYANDLKELVIKKAVAIALYYEQTVPEFTKALAEITSAPGQKGITVTLNEGLVKEFETNAYTAKWFNTIADKHYDFTLMGGNSLAYGGRALSIAATNIDPTFKTNSSYGSFIRELVNEIKPYTIT